LKVKKAAADDWRSIKRVRMEERNSRHPIQRTTGGTRSLGVRKVHHRTQLFFRHATANQKLMHENKGTKKKRRFFDSPTPKAKVKKKKIQRSLTDVSKGEEQDPMKVGRVRDL